MQNNISQFPEDGLIEDANNEWLESRWGVFTGSNTHSLMSGVDDPELLDSDTVAIVLEAVSRLPKDAFSERDGKPLIKQLNERFASLTISAKERDYALKQLDPYPEGLKTYAEKVAMETITKFTPDPELTKPWIIRGKEKEVEGINELSVITGHEFSNLGHEQQILMHADDYGSTPDGVVFDGDKIITGCEGKCPDRTTHWKYLHNIKDAKSLKETEPRYYWQIQSHMLCAEADYWYFFSFDDRFIDPACHLHYCKIDRIQEDVDKILKRLDMARTYRDLYLLGDEKQKDAA